MCMIYEGSCLFRIS